MSQPKISRASGEDMVTIVATFGAMRSASAQVLPDPLEWLTFANPAASMLAGYFFRSAVLSGLQPADRRAVKQALKMAEQQFRYGMELADKELPDVLKHAGISTQ